MTAISVDALAKQYNLTKATARKWKSRTDTQDRSHCPHTLHTTLTPEQEIIVVELRSKLGKCVDNLKEYNLRLIAAFHVELLSN